MSHSPLLPSPWQPYRNALIDFLRKRLCNSKLGEDRRHKHGRGGSLVLSTRRPPLTLMVFHHYGMVFFPRFPGGRYQRWLEKD